MKKALISGVLLGALTAGSSMAADLPAKAPIMKAPVAPVFNWTGCYVNAGGGYGLWDQEHNITSGSVAAPNSFVTIDTRSGGRGWLARFGGGCDYQAGNFVIGAFGDYDWMNLNGTMSTQLINGNTGLPSQADEKESWAWAVGGRIGYLIAPMVLGYVDGGWTQTHFDQLNVVTSTGIVTGNAFPSHTYNGWFLGSGFEYNFNWLPIPGLFLRTEYRYGSYKRDDLTEFVIATGAPSGNGGLGNVIHAQKQVQTVTTSLVWRFNWGGAPVMSRY